MLRRAACVAAFVTAALCAQTRLPARSPSSSPDDFVTAIVTLRDQAVTRLAAPALVADGVIDPGSEALVAADEARASRGRALVARVAAAQRASQSHVRDLVGSLGGTTLYSARAVNAVTIRVARSALAALRARDDVALVEIDEPRHAFLDHVPSAMLTGAFWSAGITGGTIDVAVIDTGLYVGHEAFAARAGSIVDAVFHDAAVYRPEYYDIATDPDDYGGHGTFVSGMVFSQGSAAAASRRGVSYGIDKLFNLKAGYATTSGGGSSLLSDVMRAVDWSLAQADAPEIYNYSYGARISADDDSYSRYWDAIVDGYGKVATISAGNSGPLDGTVGSPGIAYNVISVANVASQGTTSRSDDVIATSSSRGPTYGGRKKPDLAAPGSSVSLPSNWGPRMWLQVTGTSFSSPATAAAAALVMDAGVADPRAVKALLINSADDLGAPGWDTAYGWGYLNGQRAYDERASTLLATVGAPGSAAGVRLYGRRAAASSKATLTWHRRVAYAAGGAVATSGTLNNLDLALYSETDNTLRALSNSTRDNVEQVDSETAGPVVMVVSSSGAFTGVSDTFALAHDGGFIPRSGPALSINVAAPGTVAPSSSFAVTATIANAGDLVAHDVYLTLTAPAGFTVEGRAASQEVGSVGVGATAWVSWTLRASPVAQSASPFSVAGASTSYGLPFSATAAGAITTASGCGYGVSNPPPLAAEGGAVDLVVTTTAGCAWSSVSDAAWAAVMAGRSGDGPGIVRVSVAPSALTAPRAARIAIANQVVTLTQEGLPAPPAAPAPRKYYLAEGAASAMFTLDIAIANPDGAPAPIEIHFFAEDGTPSSISRTLGARTRSTIRVNDLAGLGAAAVSTVVTSTNGQPLVVERTMTWDAEGYGGHTGTAVNGPDVQWYFAEGSQGMFDTYVLLANAAEEPTTATVTFLGESGLPVVRAFTLPRTSRVTVWAGNYPELVNTSFAIVVESAAPIIAERAMYWSNREHFWVGGHEAAGVPALSDHWFLAEGATGGFFDTFVLIGNPNPQPAHAIVTYLLASGESVVRSHTIAASARLTIDLEAEGDARLLNAAVSTTVTSDIGVVVERAVYWGDASGWYEGHDSFGLTETGLTWGLAEGRSGLGSRYQTYVLVANPSLAAAEISVTFLREAGLPVVKTFVVAPTSRFNIDVSSEVPELRNERYGVVVDSTNDVPIVVERAMYWDSAGLTWSGGTNATGERLR